MRTQRRQGFIPANGHLPMASSAACIVEEGLDVAKTDAMLLQKIEELTLYLLQLKDRLKVLEMENNSLRALPSP